MKISNQFYFLLLVLILGSCIASQSVNLEESLTPIPKTSKELDIPKYENDLPYTYWHYCKVKQDQLGLESPETSTDSLIFRLWITNPIGSKNQPHGLITFRYDSNSWKGNLYLMHVNFDKRNLKEFITDFKELELLPTTNWDNVIEKLNELKIPDLPTDDHIEGYYDDLSNYNNYAPTFSFEYATSTKYRFFQYSDITRNEDQFWQPQHVNALLAFFEEEFEWDTRAREYFQ